MASTCEPYGANPLQVVCRLTCRGVDIIARCLSHRGEVSGDAGKSANSTSVSNLSLPPCSSSLSTRRFFLLHLLSGARVKVVVGCRDAGILFRERARSTCFKVQRVQLRGVGYCLWQIPGFHNLHEFRRCNSALKHPSVHPQAFSAR